MKCTCTSCAMGLPNHCEGPEAAANQAQWRADYANAAAELVLVLATGSIPSEQAREQFKQRVRDASQRAKPNQAKE